MSKKKSVKTVIKKKVIVKDKAGDKVARVMQEFKDGKLKSSSGEIVTDKKQALAIALSEAGLSKSVFKSFEKVEMINKIRVMKSSLMKKIQKEEAAQEDIVNRLIGFIAKNPHPADSDVRAFAESNGINIEQMQKKIYGILSDFLTGGKSKGKQFDINPEELKMGIEVEQEHTGNKILAGKIAMDHLAENPDYYTRLLEMESEAK